MYDLSAAFDTVCHKTLVDKLTKALASVMKMSTAGNKVVFDSQGEEGSYIENEVSKKKIPIKRGNGKVVATMTVPRGAVKPIEGQDAVMAMEGNDVWTFTCRV